MGHLDEDVSPLFPKGLSINVKVSLFVAISLGLMFVDTRYDILRPVRLALSAFTAPIEYIAELPDAAGDFVHSLASRSALMKQNEELRRDQLLLSARLQKLVALESENRRIRTLLQSAKNLDDRMLIAEINATSTDPYRSYLTLNKGSTDGVFVGQALVDAYGIMGQIIEVYHYSSVALLITDPNHGIPVEIGRNSLRTIAHGEGSGLTLPYLPSNADIKVGDLLVSSGLGGRFPAGYPVGTVTEIRHTPGEHFLDISATPAAHMDRGHEVLLVWHQDEEASAAAAKPNPATFVSTPAKTASTKTATEKSASGKATADKTTAGKTAPHSTAPIKPRQQ